jgi:hypothetical protein
LQRDNEVVLAEDDQEFLSRLQLTLNRAASPGRSVRSICMDRLFFVTHLADDDSGGSGNTSWFPRTRIQYCTNTFDIRSTSSCSGKSR